MGVAARRRDDRGQVLDLALHVVRRLARSALAATATVVGVHGERGRQPLRPAAGRGPCCAGRARRRRARGRGRSRSPRRRSGCRRRTWRSGWCSRSPWMGVGGGHRCSWVRIGHPFVERRCQFSTRRGRASWTPAQTDRQPARPRLLGPAEQQGALAAVAGQPGCLGEGGRGLVVPARLARAGRRGRSAPGGSRPVPDAAATASSTARPASGPEARPWATARLTSTTGLSPTWASTSYHPAIAAQSVSPAVGGPGVAGGDLGLDDVGPDGSAGRARSHRAVEAGQAAADQQLRPRSRGPGRRAAPAGRRRP